VAKTYLSTKEDSYILAFEE